MPNEYKVIALKGIQRMNAAGKSSCPVEAEPPVKFGFYKIALAGKLPACDIYVDPRRYGTHLAIRKDTEARQIFRMCERAVSGTSFHCVSGWVL